jgi:hypothetical protein
MNNTASTNGVKAIRPPPSHRVCLLYFLVTVIVNLAVLASLPGNITPDFAPQCIGVSIVPIFWGAYLPFRCRSTYFSLAWCISFLAIVGAIFWLWLAAELTIMVMKY